MKKIILIFVAILSTVFSNAQNLTPDKEWRKGVAVSENRDSLVNHGWVKFAENELFESYYNCVVVDSMQGFVKVQTLQLYTEKAKKEGKYCEKIKNVDTLSLTQIDYLVDVKNNKMAKIAIIIFGYDGQLFEAICFRYVPKFFIDKEYYLSYTETSQKDYPDFFKQFLNSN